MVLILLLCFGLVFCFYIFGLTIFGQFPILKTHLTLRKGKASNSKEQNPLESCIGTVLFCCLFVFFLILYVQFTARQTL